MAKYILWIALTVLLPSCTWINEYRVKSRATDQINKQLRGALTNEFEQTVAPESQKKNDFVEFILARTEIQFVEVTKGSDDRYSVVLKVHTVSPEARRTLLEIIRPLQGGDLNAFNFTDGLEMIRKKNSSLKMEGDEEIRIHTSL